MVRLTLILIGVMVGAYYSIQGPFYALLFYLGNAYFRPEDWLWSDWLVSLRLSLVIGIIVAFSTLLARPRLIWNGRVALLWSFLGVALASSFYSTYFDYSWPYAIEFFKLTLIGYLIVVLTTDYSKFRLTVLVIVLALGVLQAKQGWAYLITSPGWRNDNSIPFLGDNNGTAVGMLMLVPLIGFLAETSEKRWARSFFVFILIGCLYRALSTYSRGGVLAAIAMAVVWCLRSRQKLRNILGAVVIAAIVLPMLPSAFWDRVGTIQTYEQDGDRSALGRFHFWSVALRMASENPVLGVGFNGYNKAYDTYDDSYGEFGEERSVHSSILGVLAETGYVGLIIYLAILWCAFRACAYTKKSVTNQPRQRHLEAGAMALETSLVAFLVGGSFVPLQYNEMLWHILALSTALMGIAVQTERARLVSMNCGEVNPPPELAIAVLERNRSHARGLYAR